MTLPGKTPSVTLRVTALPHAGEQSAAPFLPRLRGRCREATEGA